MSSMHRAGATAAAFAAIAYAIGLALMAGPLNPEGASAWNAGQRLGFLLQHQVVYQLLNGLLYIAFGPALIVLTLALDARLRLQAPGLMRLATACGLIWAGLLLAAGMVLHIGIERMADLHGQDPALAINAWTVLGILHDGLGGGVELIGGLWMLLIAAAAWRGGGLPRALCLLGALAGMLGVLTVLPPLKDLGMGFGLLQLPWFAGVAWVLSRSPVTPATLREC
jgi:hypothetical protein